MTQDEKLNEAIEKIKEAIAVRCIVVPYADIPNDSVIKPLLFALDILNQVKADMACPECKGTGWIHKDGKFMGGEYQRMHTVCSACGGAGTKEAYNEKSYLRTLQLAEKQIASLQATIEKLQKCPECNGKPNEQCVCGNTGTLLGAYATVSGRLRRATLAVAEKKKL